MRRLTKIALLVFGLCFIFSAPALAQEKTYELRQCRQLIFAQIAIHLICTAAKNDDVFLAYLVAMPRQRFSSRNAFSTKCRRL